LGARLALAKRFIESSDALRAKRVLTALIEKYPDAPEAKEAAQLLKRLD
jgi:TolA-binding protein